MPTNYDEMTGPQLVQEYNRMAAEKGMTPVKKFTDLKTGIRRCKILADGSIPAAVKAVEEKKPTAEKPKASGRHARVIRTTYSGNPRRKGSDAFLHYEAMKGGLTVGQYLAKFAKEDQQRASQWLWNTIRDGYAELLG